MNEEFILIIMVFVIATTYAFSIRKDYKKANRNVSMAITEIKERIEHIIKSKNRR
jgi:hypothetical protein|tara:strand:+ start:377 stop:541 length:165 start_codon:yes stop_codon:yes gene_type:complete